jgi:hypothetical protein
MHCARALSSTSVLTAVCLFALSCVFARSCVCLHRRVCMFARSCVFVHPGSRREPQALPRNSSLFFSNEYGGVSGAGDQGVAGAQSPTSTAAAASGAGGSAAAVPPLPSRPGAGYSVMYSGAVSFVSLEDRVTIGWNGEGGSFAAVGLCNLHRAVCVALTVRMTVTAARSCLCRAMETPRQEGAVIRRHSPGQQRVDPCG